MPITKVPSKTEWESIGKLVLLAAFADKKLKIAEREAFRKMTEDWTDQERREVLHPVFAEAVELEVEAAKLKSQFSRRLAFQAAWQMCQVDGEITSDEEEFLRRLTKALSRSKP